MRDLCTTLRALCDIAGVTFVEHPGFIQILVEHDGWIVTVQVENGFFGLSFRDRQSQLEKILTGLRSGVTPTSPHSSVRGA